jgi:hypothetical protein
MADLSAVVGATKLATTIWPRLKSLLQVPAFYLLCVLPLCLYWWLPINLWNQVPSSIWAIASTSLIAIAGLSKCLHSQDLTSHKSLLTKQKTEIQRLKNILESKINADDYEHFPSIGFLKNKKDNQYYCKSCLKGRQLSMPLDWINLQGFVCRWCGEKYTLEGTDLRYSPDFVVEINRASDEIKSNPEYQERLKKHERRYK